VYSTQNLQRRTGQAFSTREFLEKQLATLQEELQTSELALQQYKTSTGIITLADEVQASLRRLTQVAMERATVEADLGEAQSVLNLLHDRESTSGAGLMISTSGMSNLLIVELSKQLTSLEIDRSSLEKVFTARHPTVIAIRTQIEEARRRLIGEVEGAVLGLRERERALTATAESYEKNLRDLPEAELTLVGLLRTSEVNESIYTFLLEKYEEARIVEASELGNVYVIDPAIPPTAPFRPRKKLNTVFGAIFGLMIGIGMAFLLESLDNSINTAEDIESALGLPVFGVIPKMTHNGLGKTIISVSTSRDDAGTLLIRAKEPGFMAIEAYRSLRTNLQYAEPDRRAKAVLVSSAMPQEGKTTTVTNLAIALAHTESQVLLIGGDLRKPEIYTAFGTPQEPGLTEILTGTIDWRSTIQPSGFEGLMLIPSGRIPPNPVDILSSKRLPTFLEAIKAEFDIILFDSPPVLGFADAAILGNKLDVYCCRSWKNDTPDVGKDKKCTRKS